MVDWGYSTSKVVSASVALKGTRTRVKHVTIKGSTSKGYLKLYDAASAAGTAIWECETPADPDFRLAATIDLDFIDACYMELSNVTVSVVYY